MNLRHLGNGLSCSAIGLGCMGFSQGYGGADDRRSVTAIQDALSAGITLFDTAMSYGSGHNEQLLGAALRGSGVPREQYRIASKFGIVRGPDGVALDARPERVPGWCDASLHRLGVDHLDLFYLHRPDPTVPIEESVGAMRDLVTAGKVRQLGVSEVTPEQLTRAHAIHPLAAVQLEWSLMWRTPELDIIPAARRLGVGIVPYSPLGRGLLGGHLQPEGVADSPFRASDPRFQHQALRTNLHQVDALVALAAEWGMSPAQLALAWLLAQGDDVVPIPGSRAPARIVENAGAAEFALDKAQLDRIDQLVPPGRWAGDRASFAVPVTTRR
ncbi:aldo/keto reductase [Flexivirga meconopsidis]|uniref:aldo/keto reductase n=1 Tax=Flexivirga meconopsidis TaxID=2977121 RepID=UPI00223FB2D1|nr:aldo/keto reductase [Flexivirga meconopsidis]